MVKSIKSNFRKNRNTKGSIGKRARASKINASTLYETCSEQLSPFGGLLAVIKFLDLLGFEIFLLVKHCGRAYLRIRFYHRQQKGQSAF